MTLKVTILKCTIQWNLVPHNIVQPPALTTYKTFVKVKVAQSCLSLCNPMDYTDHGILQTRILNWVAVPFSKGSSQLRDQTQLSWISCRFFTSWASREGYKHFYYPQKHSPHSLGSRCLFLLYPRTLLSDKQPSFCINGFTNSIYSMHMEWDYIGLFESGFFHLACSWGSFT